MAERDKINLRDFDVRHQDLVFANEEASHYIIMGFHYGSAKWCVFTVDYAKYWENYMAIRQYDNQKHKQDKGIGNMRWHERDGKKATADYEKRLEAVYGKA